MKRGLIPHLLASASGRPAVATDPRPASADATLLELRPSGRRIATLRVGPARTYSTITAALTAAQAAQTARASGEGVSLAALGGHPDYRVDILVDPGTYAETLTTKRDVAIYSATGISGDVVVTGAIDALGCLVSEGGAYVEGITFHRGNVDGITDPATELPKYAQHHSSSGRNSVFAACTFHTEVARDGGWQPIGMDGYNGGVALWYDCALTSNGTDTYAWLHGGATNTVPGVYMFINTEAPGIRLYYDSLHASLADEFWVVGGKCGSIDTDGAGTVLHYDPASTTGAVTPSGPSDNDVDWSVPAGGLTEASRAFYYPWL